MKIVFTKHALKKFMDLKDLDISVSRKMVLNLIENPEHLDKETDFPNLIASKVIDKSHILRVVYKEESDRMVIITFYPARKGRYY